jgi:hypothetical protein
VLATWVCVIYIHGASTQEPRDILYNSVTTWLDGMMPSRHDGKRVQSSKHREEESTCSSRYMALCKHAIRTMQSLKCRPPTFESLLFFSIESIACPLQYSQPQTHLNPRLQ